MLFYRIARVLAGGGTNTIFRARVEGRDNLPATGGYILASSHRSMVDITMAAWVSPRPLRYMGKASLFNVPVLGSVFRLLGGFEVQRDGSDRKALRNSIEMLRGGEVLLVYPEGTRQNGPKIEPLQPGAAYLALRAGVPIVPVGMAGTEEIFRTHGRKFPRFGRIAVVVGEPLAVHDREAGGVVPRAEVDALTSELHEALQRVFDAANALRSQT